MSKSKVNSPVLGVKSRSRPIHTHLIVFGLLTRVLDERQRGINDRAIRFQIIPAYLMLQPVNSDGPGAIILFVCEYKLIKTIVATGLPVFRFTDSTRELHLFSSRSAGRLTSIRVSDKHADRMERFVSHFSVAI